MDHRDRIHLLPEQVGGVQFEADAGRVHGQAAGDVGVAGAEDDLAVAVFVGRPVVEEQLDLRGAALVEPGSAVLAEDLGTTARFSG